MEIIWKAGTQCFEKEWQTRKLACSPFLQLSAMSWLLKPAGRTLCMLWLKAAARKRLGTESSFGGCSFSIRNHAYPLPGRSIQRAGEIRTPGSPGPVGGLAAVPLSVRICFPHSVTERTSQQHAADTRLASSHRCLKPFADLFWPVLQRWTFRLSFL